jgi:hypothetical protein
MRILSGPSRNRKRSRIVGISLAAGVLGSSLMLAAAPAEASPPPTCNGVHCIVSWTTVGVGQTWTVPAGVTSVNLELYGAIGGSDGTEPGGAGAKITGTLTVTPAEVVTLDIGGPASTWHGGINGGGDGGSTGVGGAGGGGMTDARQGGIYQLIAAGGGGAGGTGGGVCSAPNPSLGGSGGSTENHGGQAQNSFWTTVTLSAGGFGDAGQPSGDNAGGLAGTANSPTSGCSGENTATSAGATGANGTADHGGGGVTNAGGGGGAGAFGGGQGGSGATSAPGAFDPSGDAAASGGGGGGSSAGLAADFYQLVDDAGNHGQINNGSGDVYMVYADPGTPSSPSSPSSGGSLPVTGTNTAEFVELAALGLALLIPGAGLTLLARRRLARHR